VVAAVLNPTRHLSEGDRLGKYEVLRHIATGSIAELYLARIVGLDDIDKLVVVKRLLPQYVSNSGLVEVFLNEARLSATLQHQNIAQVHDIGIANGNFFFAMEYVHGEDLDRITIEAEARRVPISLDAALTLVSGLCAALHYAHEKAGADGLPLRIVHRDVSPSNLVVSHAGAVKLLDFGVARAMSLQQRATRGGIKGKIAYVSPEQCRSSVGIDQRSDLFSVGVVLYQLTTGRLPFTGETEYELLHKIVNEAPPPPRTFVADYPRGLESIVMRALAQDVEHRYSTALELQAELEDFAHTERLRISTLVLTRLMSTLFPGGTKEWNHARAIGESFVEKRISVSIPAEPPPAEDPGPRPAPPSPRCVTQGRVRRPSSIQPPRASTRGRTDSVLPYAPPPRSRTESVNPSSPALRSRTESGIPANALRSRTDSGVPAAPPQRSRVVTIPPLRSDRASATGIPIMALPSTPSTTSNAIPIAIPSGSDAGDATTRRLAAMQGVFVPLQRTPAMSPPLPALAVRPLATPVPGSQRVAPLQSAITEVDEPRSTSEALAVPRSRRAARRLVTGLVVACIALVVDVTIGTEASERVWPPNVTGPSAILSARGDVQAAPVEMRVVSDPRADAAARGDTGDSDAEGEVDDSDVVAVSLRLDEPPAAVVERPHRPRSRGARVASSSKTSRARAAGSVAPAVSDPLSFDAWKYSPTGTGRRDLVGVSPVRTVTLSRRLQ
jgi:serine/threonine protein kinase